MGGVILSSERTKHLCVATFSCHFKHQTLNLCIAD